MSMDHHVLCIFLKQTFIKIRTCNRRIIWLKFKTFLLMGLEFVYILTKFAWNEKLLVLGEAIKLRVSKVARYLTFFFLEKFPHATMNACFWKSHDVHLGSASLLPQGYADRTGEVRFPGRDKSLHISINIR